MQTEPIQFGIVAVSRARRSAAGFALPVRSAHNAGSDTESTSVLDAAFADFTRVDAGSASKAMQSSPTPQDLRSTTQALIADIATQLESLDSQRRQLARLLESVDSSETV